MPTPKPPPELNEPAAAEWYRILEVDASDVIDPQRDRAALAAYCQTWARWKEAEAQVETLGPVVKSPTGYPIENPHLAIARKALNQLKGLAVELGLTPRSRAAKKTKGEPQTAKTTPPPNPLARLQLN